VNVRVLFDSESMVFVTVSVTGTLSGFGAPPGTLIATLPLQIVGVETARLVLMMPTATVLPLALAVIHPEPQLNVDAVAPTVEVLGTPPRVIDWVAGLEPFRAVVNEREVGLAVTCAATISVTGID
jgi:hypothetical protein